MFRSILLLVTIASFFAALDACAPNTPKSEKPNECPAITKLPATTCGAKCTDAEISATSVKCGTASDLLYFVAGETKDTIEAPLQCKEGEWKTAAGVTLKSKAKADTAQVSCKPK